MILRLLYLSLLVCCASMNVLAANQETGSFVGRLPNVKYQMLSAGYWISAHPSPDDLVMNKEQIKKFNDHVQNDLKLTKDIFSLLEHYQIESLMDVLKKTLEDYTDKGFFTLEGVRDDNALMDKIKSNMHLSGLVLGIAPRYGVVVHLADQRFLPTSQGLYAQRGDIDFDELQNSALDVGTVVAVVHQSLDGKWLYVLSSLSDGWVKAENVAICDMKTAKSFEETDEPMVVIAPKADVYLDEDLNNFYDVLRMGASLPLIDEQEDFWVVDLPSRDKDGKLQKEKGYVPKSQALQGYLPYTARTILTQAFVMLDKPYGWGDMNAGQDCSRFLQMVFATTGIKFPRDSKNQAQIGRQIMSFETKALDQEKLASLQKVKGGLTILPLKGHIMLFLGLDHGIAYAIHETSGYSKTVDERQVKFVLNRVVVSDLSVGENSLKGSLLKRLIKIVGIEPSEN